MGDLVRMQPRKVTGLGGLRGKTAAARILTQRRTDAPQPEQWHPTAWGYRNTVGELRYAEMWLANGMARARLVAARRTAPGAEPEPLDENHPASQYMAQLAGGVGGQGALLRGFATYLTTPGVGYLVGADPQLPEGPATWQVRDATEVRLAPSLRDPESGLPMYEVAMGDEAGDWAPIGAGGLVVKVMRSDPLRAWRSDSPVRGAMPILKELVLLTQAIEAQATSRLAGAGVLPLPMEMELPPDPENPDRDVWEVFIEELSDHFTKPIKDRGLASANVPFPVRVPAEWMDKIKPVHFWTPLDEHAMALRVELIGRLGTAMDMPMAALTGEQQNHWGKAQTADEGLKLHIVPDLELVCDGITRGYLHPALARDADLAAMRDLPVGGGRLLAEATQALTAVDQDGAEIIAWYDLSDFSVKPDRSDDAVQAWDRTILPNEALLAELGLSGAGEVDPAELANRVWLKLIDGSDAGLQGLALVKLGLVDEADLPARVTSPVPAAPGAEPAEPVQTDQPGATPATEPSAPAPSDGPTQAQPTAAASVVDLALVAACDGLVHRALEKAGNRLRQDTQRQRRSNPTLDQPAVLMHTVCRAADVRPPNELLAGVFDRLPEVAGLVGADPDALLDTLHTYTLGLLRSRRPHTYAALSNALAVAAVKAATERVPDAVVA